MAEEKDETAEAAPVKMVKVQKGDEEPIEVNPSTLDAHIAAGYKEVTEEQAKGLSGPLPDDFPARDKLEAAGIKTWEGLKEAGDLTEIEGIGQATADKIAEAEAAAAAEAAEKETQE